MSDRTRVGIVGAGPAGMLVAVLLQRAGIDCVVVERRDRSYVEQRVRGATVEYPVVELLRRHDLAAGLLATGAVEDRIEFRMGGRRYPLVYAPLAGGRTPYLYPQQFLVRDLIDAFLVAGGDLRFDTTALAVTDLEGDRPRIRLDSGAGAAPSELWCDIVVGADGEHGLTRAAIPRSASRTHEYQYDYAWLAVLAEAAPSSDSTVIAIHESGACVHVPRGPVVSRFYLQCPREDGRADWPDERIWKEIRIRLALDEPWLLHEGPILSTSSLRMRSLVCAPLRYGPLFLVGDAAHIVPPVVGKGFNIALADAEELALALVERFTGGTSARLDAYSDRRLARIWRAQEFVGRVMDLVNTPGPGTREAAYLHRVQCARLERLFASPAYGAAFLEDHIGWE